MLLQLLVCNHKIARHTWEKGMELSTFCTFLFIYLLHNNIKVPSSLIFRCSHFLLLLMTLGPWVWRSFVKKFDNDEWKNDWSWKNCSSWGQHIMHLYNLPNCIQVVMSSWKYLDRMGNLFITARLKKKKNRSYLDIPWRLLLTLIVTSFHSALLSLIAELLFSISMIFLLPSRFF